MITRRGTLVAMAGATLSAVSSNGALARLIPSDRTPTPGAAPAEAGREALDERLRRDLARLAPRAYSEEGVPVFLACEDLAANPHPPRPIGSLPSFNSRFAVDFRENAAAWQRIHPDAAEGDVAKLIEVLADRDFSDGGAKYRQ
ncbi:MAG: hypothetical protein M3O06_10440 [Pseudomonadota bacterium]|nr:hypothetical protein [Pseudomonadota bacterium]